ncbi:MAG: hypothetical protein Q4D65_02430 [Peptostreptococcaceae bacterium]|nr:hypothetical protein [Peptostreptococcaceae bacterium]
MIWEVGILLIGIGILILCIFTATTIRDIGASIKRIDRILTDKDGEIETIINNAASISTEVDGIVANVNKVTNVAGIVGSVSAGIASIFGKGDETDDIYSSGRDFSDDIDDMEDLEKIFEEAQNK